jgi:hypothetical protein
MTHFFKSPFFTRKNTQSNIFGYEKNDSHLGKGAFKEAFIAKQKMPGKEKYFNKSYFSTDLNTNNFVIVNTKIPIQVLYNDPQENFNESTSLQTFLNELRIQKQYANMTPPLAPKIFKISFKVFRKNNNKFNSPKSFKQQDLYFDEFISNPFLYLNQQNAFKFQNKTCFSRNCQNYDSIIFSLFEERCGESIELTNIPYDTKFFNKLELLISSLVKNLNSFFKDFKPQNTCPFYNSDKTELTSLLALDLDPAFIDNIQDILSNMQTKLTTNTLTLQEVQQICESLMLLQYLFILFYNSDFDQQANIQNYLISKGFTKHYLQILLSFFFFNFSEFDSLTTFIFKNTFFHYLLPQNNQTLKNLKQKLTISKTDFNKVLFELYKQLVSFIFNEDVNEEISFFDFDLFLEKLKSYNSQDISYDTKNALQVPVIKEKSSFFSDLGSFGRF